MDKLNIKEREIVHSLIICSLLLSLPVRAHAQQDTLLQVMREELTADMNELQSQPLPPYFMSFRAYDNHHVSIGSNFGVLHHSQETHSRTFTPQIRLGSMELDNFKYTTQGLPQQRNMPQQPMNLPIDNEHDKAIRQSIWAETLKRYQAACSIYQETLSRQTTAVDNEDKAPCYTAQTAEKYYEAPLSPQETHIDIPAWEERLRNISTAFKACPQLQEGSATLEYSVIRSWFINTEGTEVVQNRKSARLMLNASMQAEDGMQLPLFKDYYAARPEDLPDMEQVRADVADMIQRLMALKNAPVADPYTGPAIMSGPASGVFFHEIFGHRLEGHRMKTGGQTFKKMVGERVLPSTFQVYCDPTLEEYAGQVLNGSYRYDDEGVKARRVNNVVDGVLTEFLMSRVPLDGFPQSNGHGRTSDGCDPVSRQSNLVIETTKPYTEARLRDMLAAEIKRQGKEYGYYFKSVSNGYTLTGEGGSLNSFNVTPLEVYRVYADGRPDELVRGVDLIGTPLSMFSHIEAGGDSPSVFIGSCGAESGWVPVSASSPMIFVKQIETQRRQMSRELPPVLNPPAFSEKTFDTPDNMYFAALQDEMKRTQDSLVLNEQPRPFYLRFSLARYHQLQVTAQLGSVTFYGRTPWTHMGGVGISLGDYTHTSDMQPGRVAQTLLDMEGSYNNLRRGLWNVTDKMYKFAINGAGQKKMQLFYHPLPAEEAALPDMQPLPPSEYICRRDEEPSIDEESLKALAARLSEVFAQYPEIYGSSVTIQGADLDLYKLTTEQVKLKTSHDFAHVIAQGSIRTEAGDVLSEGMEINAVNLRSLESEEELRLKIDGFARHLTAKAHAPLMDDYYKGPVMYEGMCVAIDILDRYVMNELTAKRDFLKASGQHAGQIGRQLTDSRFSILHYSDKKEYKGMMLTGHYETDDEGVRPASTLTLIDKGILKQVLNGRYPSLLARESTGNSRIRNLINEQTLSTATTPGTIHVRADKTATMAKLRKLLLKEAGKAGSSHAYLLRQEAGYSHPDLYRIDLKSGKETLVRTTKSMKLPGIKDGILGISAEEDVFNLRAHSTDISLITPHAILLQGDGELTPDNAPAAAPVPAITNPQARK